MMTIERLMEIKEIYFSWRDMTEDQNDLIGELIDELKKTLTTGQPRVIADTPTRDRFKEIEANLEKGFYDADTDALQAIRDALQFARESESERMNLRDQFAIAAEITDSDWPSSYGKLAEIMGRALPVTDFDQVVYRSEYEAKIRYIKADACMEARKAKQ